MQLSRIFRRSSKSDDQIRSNTANFLSLPPELRNIIYYHIVRDKVLTMIPKKGRRPPPPAMLLVSKQVRAEYQAILLTRATIVADVHNYDFREITAMTGSLYARDLKLLRLNDNMFIRLQCMRCRKSDLAGLRRWLVQRTNSLDRLPWQYCVGWEDKTSTHVKTSMIWGHRKLLLDMQESMKLDEGLGWELTHVLKTLDQEMDFVVEYLRERATARSQSIDERRASTASSIPQRP